MKGIGTPESHEMSPCLPTERSLELRRHVSCLWSIRVDGEVMFVGPVASYVVYVAR